jgi:hypothetical protein
VLRPVTRSGILAPARIVGAQLAAVTYRYLPSDATSAYVGGGEGVDDDLSAVVLDLGERGRTTITWAMEDDVEGLAILGPDEPYAGLADKTVGASDREAWHEHIGGTIASVGGAWQVTGGEGSPESLWAVRLEFVDGAIVVALGTVDPDLEYMPDELVVISNPSLAKSYRPRHVIDSAWGQTIDPG